MKDGMLRDDGSRERAAILERWRADFVPAPVSLPPEAPIEPRAAREAPLDEAALFAAFETELATTIDGPLANTLLGWLAAPRDSFRGAPTAEHPKALLAALDRIEDVLTAVLLSKPGRSVR